MSNLRKHAVVIYLNEEEEALLEDTKRTLSKMTGLEYQSAPLFRAALMQFRESLGKQDAA